MIDHLATIQRARDAETRADVLVAILRRLARLISWDDQDTFREVVTSKLDGGSREGARVGLERIETLFYAGVLRAVAGQITPR